MTNPRPGWRRHARRVLLGALLLLLGSAAGLAVWLRSPVFGGAPTGERLARMQRSPQWQDGRFVNPQPLQNHYGQMVTGLLRASDHRTPDVPVPVVAGGADRFATSPPTGLRVTWFGHSATLLEIDGHRVLTDPIWSERASPLGWLGPQRFFAPPVPLDRLPAIDAVVISHDHFDHLDHGTLTAMKAWDTTFVVPLGVGAHLERWGIPPARIAERDWWERTQVRDLTIVTTPARHASGRKLVDNDGTLWAGYALVGPRHRVYYSGDTGLFPAMKEIGARLGPFDLTMIEAGQYDPAWPDWHIGPEQAVVAHEWVRGKALLPVHWALFNLAYHGWTEPIERVLVAARARGVTLLAPRPGQSFEPTAPPAFERWWPERPWKTAAERPVVSTQIGPASAR
jgi:L-ascorbate metabolism protein UlaG (beta-lactamase superfamily)